MAYFIHVYVFKASPHTRVWNVFMPIFGTMQWKTTKFGVVVVANSSCMHLDLYLCSCFSCDVVSISLYTVHIYVHAWGVMHSSVLGNVLMAFLHIRATDSHDIWLDCST